MPLRKTGQILPNGDIQWETMAIPTRATSHGTFFISTQTYNRRRLFQVEASAELLLETFQHYRKEGHYLLHAFVIMPDHIHLLLTPQGISLERAVQLIKGGFSRKTQPQLQAARLATRLHRPPHEGPRRVPQVSRLHPLQPVHGHLCQLPEDYAYSSAYRSSR